MIVYTARKDVFIKDADNEEIHDLIHQQFQRKLLRKAAPNQILAWKNSMQHMRAVLDDNEIPDDARVHIEYTLPSTNRSIDFILTGMDAEMTEKVVIIELKQWSEVEKTSKDGIVKTRLGGKIVETSHPSYQAWSYSAYIEDFNETVRNEKIQLRPCAYLHNLSSEKVIRDEFYEPHLKNAPVFISRDAKRLSDFLKKHVKYGDNKEIMYRIENGKIKPSKHLADSIAKMLESGVNHREFIMLDDQKLAFETAMKAARGINDDKKQTLIIHGGPGTGKSVVAINLLSELLQQDLNTHYVSKNAAPRHVYRSLLTGTMSLTRINNLFKGSGAYIDSQSNSIDVLIVDEAHRLSEKGGFYGTDGENQIKEIIDTARLSIFFIDEDQRVTYKDIGHSNEIKKWAKSLGSKVSEITLHSQFRCNGSNAYLAFTDDLLQIRDTPNKDIQGLGYEVSVMDSPNQLVSEIINRNNNNKARVVAGYCWDWKSKNLPTAYDIEFPEFKFKAQWNLGSDGSAWAIAKNSAEQIGCIHTCQGLEFDYVGVIIGPDLVVRDGVVVTDGFKRSKNDQSIKGFKSQFKENPDAAALRVDAIIKNTYRTLMTRGQKGCFIYCTDKETNEYFKSRINALPQSDSRKYFDLKYKVKPANEVKPYVDSVPVYEIDSYPNDLKYQDESEVDWIVLPEKYIGTDYFVARFRGKSEYENVLPGDWCLFKTENSIDGKERYLVRDGEVFLLSESPGEGTKLLAEFVALLD